MAGMCRGLKSQFQNDWNVLWYNMSVSSCLECVMIKNVSFSMAEVCLGQKCLFQHNWNVSWSKV
jgi:hypothetical protein